MPSNLPGREHIDFGVSVGVFFFFVFLGGGGGGAGVTPSCLQQ